MRKIHMEQIASTIVQITSPAERRVLGMVKDGTQNRIAIILWKRITSTASATPPAQVIQLHQNGTLTNSTRDMAVVRAMASFIIFLV